METRRGGLDTLAAHYAEQGAPKGEVCLCVAGPLPPEAASEAEIDAALQQALETASVKVAAAEVAERLGLPKRSVYQRAITHRKGESTEGK